MQDIDFSSGSSYTSTSTINSNSNSDTVTAAALPQLYSALRVSCSLFDALPLIGQNTNHKSDQVQASRHNGYEHVQEGTVSFSLYKYKQKEKESTQSPNERRTIHSMRCTPLKKPLKACCKRRNVYNESGL